MELKKLTIEGLFGHFNHRIEFRKGNVTIITAPNGYGKTVCLKVIDSIFNRKTSFLFNLQFKLITLETSDGSLSIHKEDEKNENKGLLVIKHSNVKKTHKIEPEYNLIRKFSLNSIEKNIPFLTRIGPREWVDERYDEVLDYDDVVDNFKDALPGEFSSKEYPQWFIKFTDSLNAHFIQDQRLIQRQHSSVRGRKISFTDTIEKFADELSELIKRSGFMSSHVSQQLDTTFPERLIRKDKIFNSLPTEKLKDELKDLQKKRTDLSTFDLLSSAQHLPALDILDEIKDEDAKVLTLYVQDTKEKLSSYDDIYRKIELFSRILNNKRLSFKKIKINSENGFQFETESGRPLKLTQLSSGEQHQVVLLYELIFKTGKNVLVLIDEPEISLHVAWQKEFLNDLKEIVDIQEMPVVIATHSPQIIDGNWELTVDLEEGSY